MIPNIRNILTFLVILSGFLVQAEQIWYEKFLIPEKGIWGKDESQVVESDFSEIENWLLEYKNISLTSPGDYAKTVSTSGGRFEARDIDGEVVWRSEWIDISKFNSVSVSLNANETGSGANENNKYIKAFFRLNNGDEILFNSNGINAGNWGAAKVEQNGIGGDSLQIVVYMANHYSADKVILDEILVSGETEDKLPPYIASVKVKSADTIVVYFNEPVNNQLLAKDNFTLYFKNGEVPVLDISKTSNNFVCLIIGISRVCEITLTVDGIVDLFGNVTGNNSFSFLYLPPVQPYDIIINEILADPVPKQQLPEYEYLELYNRALYPVQIKNWMIAVNGTQKRLEEIILLPHEYLILVSTGGFPYFGEYGNVLAVKGFPSLINKGALVQLISDEDIVIDEINYSLDWPLSNEKLAGGWSIERTDPNRFCGQSNNWGYSEDLLGGTPGFENSNRMDNQDNLPPELINVEAFLSGCLEIEFSELLDTAILYNGATFFVSDGIGTPDSIKLLSSKQIVLCFSKSFLEDKTYGLEFANIGDECGNTLEITDVTFTWSVARKGDIVINELLSNPYHEGADFVELYNKSSKIIHLDHLFISNGKDTIRLNSLLNEEVILAPHNYMVCTKDSLKVVLPYFSACTKNIYEISGFPVIYNNEGSLFLLNGNFEIIDKFNYNKKLHSPILAEIEGVSLERFSFDSETNDPGGWHSAAESYGYATPGCENSQAEKEQVTSVTFEPESFSPNLDGYNDEYHINYELSKAGYIANTWIYDSSGRLVTQIVKNEILATQGNITWNGEDETGQKLPYGVYVVLLEIFDFNGTVNRFKDAVVLTGLMD